VTYHLRVLEPDDGIYAFYDGRIAGYRFADRPNWVDDGALSLGIASYALVRADAALVYDTHVSVEPARTYANFWNAGECGSSQSCSVTGILTT
jgi:cyclase